MLDKNHENSSLSLFTGRSRLQELTLPQTASIICFISILEGPTRGLSREINSTSVPSLSGFYVEACVKNAKCNDGIFLMAQTSVN